MSKTGERRLRPDLVEGIKHPIGIFLPVKEKWRWMREFRGYRVRLAMTERSSHDACGVIEECVLGLNILDIEIAGPSI